MFVARFDPKKRIVWLEVRLFGPLGYRDCRFILDTGTTVTVVDPGVVDGLGYSARMATARSRLVGIDGVQEGYRLEVAKLEALGFSVDHHEVFCHDFDDRLGVEGLIGMDLLDGRVVTLDGIEGRIIVDSV